MSHPHAQTIDDLLSDSLIQAVMKADRVEAESLKGLLKAAATRLAAGRVKGATLQVRFAGERRAAPASASLQLLPPEWRTGCAAGLCC